jgi:hypothetical protein
VIAAGSETRLYYIGWQRCQRVPYMLFGGLAVAAEGVRFTKPSPTPILDRTPDEPYSRSAPFVMRDGEMWRMYYWSCVRWSMGTNGVHYNNVIRTAVSSDGVQWSADTHVCVEPNFIDEYSIGRPWVVRDGATYRMWYSIRSFSKLYAIGYAESRDGRTWERRDDEAGITASDTGWDSEMICYPCVVDAAGKRYMFYNGNRHGATGFGYAILES